MKKRLTAIITIIMLLVPMMASAFNDIRGHWAESYINEMSELGYVKGYDDGSFKPNNRILRSEFSSIICHVYDLPVVSDERYIFFEDITADAWYAKYIPAMSFILPIYDDLLFHPHDELTRFEAAYSMLIIYNCEPSYDNSAAMDMDDYYEFSDDAMVANVVSTALENGIMFGRDGRFDPFESMTRAELSTLIVRMIEERGTYFPAEAILEELETIAYMLENDEYYDDTESEDYWDSEDYYYQDTEEDYWDSEDEYYWDTEEDYQDSEYYYEEPENEVVDNKPADENSLEYQVFMLVNEERAKEGVAPLEWDDDLANVAREHSEDMVARGFFDHTNPDGLSPFDRMKNYGITYGYAAENIAAGSRTAEEVMNQWMNSQGHHANIMNPNYKKLGVGMATGGTYGVYWTQCFTD